MLSKNCKVKGLVLLVFAFICLRLKEGLEWVMDYQNWKNMKEEYVSGNIDHISAFLEKKGVKRNGYVSRMTRGWNESRWSYQTKLRAAKEEEAIKYTSKVDAEFNARRLRVARNLQLIGLRALQYQKPKTVLQSVKMLAVGLREEREAMGLNSRGDNSSFNQTEPMYMKTRFAQELKESLYRMSDEKFVELVTKWQDN